jgi:hypothetical protein
MAAIVEEQRKRAEKGGKGRKRAEKSGKQWKRVIIANKEEGRQKLVSKSRLQKAERRGRGGTAVPNGSNLREIAEKSGKGRKRAEKGGKEWKRVKWQTKKSPGR